MRSNLFSFVIALLLVFATACTSKHDPPGDSEDPVIDVSDLECAGLEGTSDQSDQKLKALRERVDTAVG